jgi:long-subunit acyl-CoA synthetase (AMP-forming)
VRDKQNIFWMLRYVKGGKWNGLKDTPSSLVQRACDAFARRPCLGIASHAVLPSSEMPRSSDRLVLARSACAELSERNGFVWLHYKDLGRMVVSVAKGLLSSGLHPGDHVAISGYNDFEWAVADFAVAVAGMVSIGLHTTYPSDKAVDVLRKAKCKALCVMGNLLNSTDSRPGKWTVRTILHDCNDLTIIIGMDVPSETVRLSLQEASKRTASFLEWVDPANVTSDVNSASIPNPYQARGGTFTNAIGETRDCSTLLVTSGSSGQPKLVAVGVDAFVNDVCGDNDEGRAISQSVTVSYIPLSHSSDRYSAKQPPASMSLLVLARDVATGTNYGSMLCMVAVLGSASSIRDNGKLMRRQRRTRSSATPAGLIAFSSRFACESPLSTR